MSLFDQLLADPWAERHFLVRMSPRNPFIGAAEELYFSDHGFRTEPDDALPNTLFVQRLLTTLTLRRSMFSPERIGGLSIPDFGTLSLANADGRTAAVSSISIDGSATLVTVVTAAAHGYDTGDRIRLFNVSPADYIDAGGFVITAVDETTFTFPITGSPSAPTGSDVRSARGLDFLRTYGFDGAEIVIYLGGTLSDGTILGYSDYGVIFQGTAAGDATVAATVEIRLRSNDYKLQRAVQDRLYRGTSHCLFFNGSSDYVTTTLPMPAGSVTLEALVQPSSTANSTKYLHGVRNGTSAGLRALLFDTGANNRITFQVRNDAGTLFAATYDSLASGVEAQVAGVLDTAAGAIYLLVDGVQRAMTTVSGAWTTSLSNHKIGRSPDAGSNFFDGFLDEVRVWPVARTAAEILGAMGRELTLVEAAATSAYWKLNDNSGTTAVDASPNARTGTLTGCTWSSLWEGFPDLEGKPRPLLYGEVLELEPVAVDPSRLVYQWHDRTSQKLQAVYDNGVALRPPFAFTATNISFTSGTKTIACATADFTSLLIGQVITISGSAANSGDKTIATVAADGKSLTITAAVTTEAAGPSVTIVHKTGTNGYVVDLTNGRFTLTSNPVGRVTCWARGDNVGGYVNTTGAIIRRMAVRHGGLIDPKDIATAAFAAIDSAQPAPVGIYLRDPAQVLDVVNELAGGAGCWLGFSRVAGQIQIGRLEPVTGISVASYDDDPILGAIEPIPLDPPVWRVTVRYARNYASQGAQDLAGVVATDPARWSFATNEWRSAVAQDPAIREAHPNARELTIDSCFVYRADAQAEADRLLALYGVRHDYVRVPLRASPYGRDIGEEVTLFGSRGDMDAGRNGIIVGFAQSEPESRIGLEVWL